MEAKQLIDGAAFDSETAKACGDAFDQAWAIVVLRKSNTDISDLRVRFADAILRNAKRFGTDVNALVQAALSEVLTNSGAEP
jgi:hypothetical protein